MLEPRTGEVFQHSANIPDNTRVNIAARSVWVRGQPAYFNVSINFPKNSYEFALLRVTNLYIRGSRSHTQNITNTREVDIGVINYES